MSLDITLGADENHYIEDKVYHVVSDQMGVDKTELSYETHYENDLNADSLDTVELIQKFEDEFGINIPDEAAMKIRTIGQTIHYIQNLPQYE